MIRCDVAESVRRAVTFGLTLLCVVVVADPEPALPQDPASPQAIEPSTPQTWAQAVAVFTQADPVDSLFSIDSIAIVRQDGTVDVTSQARSQHQSTPDGMKCARAIIGILDTTGLLLHQEVKDNLCAPDTGFGTARVWPSQWSFTIPLELREHAKKVAILHVASNTAIEIGVDFQMLMAARARELGGVVLKGAVRSAFWNTWFHGVMGPVEKLRIGEDYTFEFHLSPHLYSELRSQGVATSPEFLAQLSQIGDQTWRIWAKPVLLGRGLEFLPDSQQMREFSIEMSRLRSPPEGRRVGEEFDTYAKRVFAGRGSVRVRASAPGCVAVAVSFWNSSLSRPVDHIVRWVNVETQPGARIPAGSIQADDCVGVTGSNTVAGSTLLELWRPSRRAAGGLHLFELQTPNGGVETSAVWVVDGRAERARSWRLFERPSTYLTARGLAQRIKIARHGGDYSAVGADLAGALFTGAGTDDDREAKMALDELTGLLQARPADPLVTVLVTPNGIRSIWPLHLLRVGTLMVGDAITVVQSLPDQARGQSSPCVSGWTSLVSSRLEGLDHRSLAKSLDTAPMHNRLRTIDEMQRHLGDVTQSEIRGSSPEGLLVLAHHDNGTLWFDDPSKDIRARGITRTFPVGSVVVLVTCRSGDPALDQARTNILRRLSQQGIEAMITSSFDVPIVVGAAYVLTFSKELRQVTAGANGEYPTLAEVHRKVTDALSKDVSVNHLVSAVRELFVVGDETIRVCPKP